MGYGEDLEGVGRKSPVIRIHCMEIYFQLKKSMQSQEGASVKCVVQLIRLFINLSIIPVPSFKSLKFLLVLSLDTKLHLLVTLKSCQIAAIIRNM